MLNLVFIYTNETFFSCGSVVYRYGHFETSKLVSLRRIIYFNDVFHRNYNSLTFINVKSFLLKRGMKNQYVFPKVFHGNVILPLFFLSLNARKKFREACKSEAPIFHGTSFSISNRSHKE